MGDIFSDLGFHPEQASSDPFGALGFVPEQVASTPKVAAPPPVAPQTIPTAGKPVVIQAPTSYQIGTEETPRPRPAQQGFINVIPPAQSKAMEKAMMEKPDEMSKFISEMGDVKDLILGPADWTLGMKDLVPADSKSSAARAMRGILTAADSLLTPRNIELAAVIGPAAKAVPGVLTGKLVKAGVEGYFGVKGVEAALNRLPDARKHYNAGDWNAFAEDLGYSSAQALLGAFMGYRAGKTATRSIGEATEAQNAKIEQILKQEAQAPSYNPALGQDILGAEAIPVKIEGKDYTVQPSGTSADGRPAYNVVGAGGKAIFGGFGQEVQAYLRQRGAVPNAPVPEAGNPAIVEPAQAQPGMQSYLDSLGFKADQPASGAVQPAEFTVGATFETPRGPVTIASIDSEGRIFSTRKGADGRTIKSPPVPPSIFRTMVGAPATPASAAEPQPASGVTTPTAGSAISQPAAQPASMPPGTPGSPAIDAAQPASSQVAAPSSALDVPREIPQAQPSTPEVLDMADVKPPAKETFAKVGESGKAIVDNMHDMLWKKVEKGETTEAGAPSALLQVAARIRKAGGLTTQDQFREFTGAFAGIPSAGTTAESQRDRTQKIFALAAKYTPKVEAPGKQQPPPAESEVVQPKPSEQPERAGEPERDIYGDVVPDGFNAKYDSWYEKLAKSNPEWSIGRLQREAHEWASASLPKEKAGEPEKLPRTIQADLPRQETFKPEVAESLAPGSTRTNPDGSIEELKEVDLSKIRHAAPTEERPQGNVIYPDVVKRYVDNPSPIAPELRPGEGDLYTIHEGHHRIESAKERGESRILAWVPKQKEWPERLDRRALFEHINSLNAGEINGEGVSRQLGPGDEFVLRRRPMSSIWQNKEQPITEWKVQEYREISAATQPPIVVSASGEVIDGQHRYRASLSRGDKDILVYEPANGVGKGINAEGANASTEPKEPASNALPVTSRESTNPANPAMREPANPATVQSRFPKGTEVEFKIAGGKTLRGTVERVNDIGSGKHTVTVRPTGKKGLMTVNADYAKPVAEIPTNRIAPQAEAKPRTTKVSPATEHRREFYTPGNVIFSGYWHTYDKVLAYDEKPDGAWTVTVQGVNEDGSPKAGAEIRKHSTPPDKGSRIVSQAISPEQKAQDLQSQFTGSVQTEHLSNEEVDQVADIFNKAEAAPPAAQEQMAQFSATESMPPSSVDQAIRSLRFWLGNVEESAQRITSGTGTTHDARVIHQGPLIAQRIANWIEEKDNERFQREQSAIDKVTHATLIHSVTAAKYDDEYARDEAAHYEPFINEMRDRLDNYDKGNGFVQTAAQKQPKSETGTEQSEMASGQARLADELLRKLRAGFEIGNNIDFQKLADEAFGGSRAQGKYSMKQAYDALEAAVNRYIADSIGPDLLSADYKFAIEQLREIMAKLPTQNIRSEQQELLQQFSTPPTLSFIAAKAAGIRAQDEVLEPSAGTGSLLAWAKAAGAILHGNEIDPDRAALLGYAVRGSNPTGHDAEFLNATLPADIKPTVVLMNPPFSATGGRVKSNKNTFGYRHVTEALKRLQPGGRLVAILGEGAQMNAPNAKEFWQDIAKGGATVRANIGISGKEYAKYGTTFGNRLLIVDKVSALDIVERTGKPIEVLQRNFDKVEDAYAAIADIANDRQAIERPASTPVAQSDRGVRGATGEERPVPQRGSGESRTPATGETPARVPQSQPERGAEPVRGEEPGPRSEEKPATRTSAGNASDSGESAIEPLREDDRVALESRKEADLLERTEDDSAFVEYVPTIQGLAHPGRLVETKVMASVNPPTVTYRPNLPANNKAPKPLSAAQMEAVARAGMMHEQFDESGNRLAILVGDGTGVGKGQELAAIAWDRYRSGQKRILWVSASKDLKDAAEGDFIGIGAPDLSKKLRSINEWNAVDKIDLPDGVVFSTYSSLIAKAKGERGQTRLDQIKEWLGPDGVMIFDEGHKAKNAVAGGARAEQSKTGAAVVKIQEDLPKAYVVYSSATSATDVNNLGYMTRLGAWGPGTSFPNGFNHFMSEVGRGGVAAMEMISRELKAQGRYISRSISYKGVTYEEKIHELTPEQTQTYDVAARAWQRVLTAAKEQIRENNSDGSSANGEFAQAFWGEHQRFFRKLLTAMKVPTVLDLADKALADGKSVFISLIGTGQAQAEKAISEGADEDDLDFSPKDSLIAMVRNSYPTILYEEYEDDQGNIRKRPVVRDGKVIENPDAVAKRDALIEEIERELKLPDNPLDFIIRYYGRDKVAELTGRRKTVERNSGTGKWESVSRAPEGVAMQRVNAHEMQEFQSGKKRIAIGSKAAGTGISLHADLTAKNQQPRFHIVMELSWSADDQMQSFGRTHRSNQKQPPEYVIVSTNAGGEKRFSSTIARRLESLGALTKGQRDASGGGSVLAKYNFETEQGQQAAQIFYRDMLQGTPGEEFIPGTTMTGEDVLRQMGVLKQRVDRNGDPAGAPYMDREDTSNVTRLLNRILNVEMGNQNAVYERFISIFDSVVQRAIEAGTLDTGVNLVRGDRIKLVSSKAIAKDPKSGAETFHYVVEAEQRTEPLEVREIHSANGRMYKRREPHPENPNQYAWIRKTNVPITTRAGAVEDAYAVAYPVNTAKAKLERIPESELNQYWEPIEGAENVQNLERLREQSVAYDNLAKKNPDSPYYKKEAARIESDRKAQYAQIRDIRDRQFDTWQAAIDAAPKSVKTQIHMIGGSVMRVWSHLNVGGGRMDIRIAYPDTGGSVTGVVMSEGDANRVERSLTGEKVERSAGSVFDALIAGKERFALTGGIRLAHGRINREPIAEIITTDPNTKAFLDTLGVSKERMGWQWRYYIPNDRQRGLPILEKILKQYPVQEDDLPKDEGASLDVRRNPGERGAAPVGLISLVDLMAEGGKKAAEVARGSNYSIGGSIETATTRGLGQTKRASVPVHEAALRAASPEARAAAIIKASIPLLHKTLVGTGINTDMLFTYYVDSRLQGLRDRWNRWAEEAEALSDDQMEAAFGGVEAEGDGEESDGTIPRELVHVLANLEGKQGIPENPAQVAAAHVESGDWDGLREYLANVFSAAADSVRPVMLPGEFDVMQDLVRNDPHVREADQIYADHIEGPLRDNHLLNDGVLTDTLGPAGRYFPLMPAGDDDAHKGFWERLGFKKPKNQRNKMATGLSGSGYTTAPEEFRKGLARDLSSGGRASLIQAAYNAGLMRKLPRTGVADPDVYKWRGEEYPSRIVTISEPRLIIQNGKTIHTPGTRAAMPTWFYQEIKDILDKDKRPEPGIISKALNFINTVAIQGPADLLFHSSNLVGALIANTPFLGESLGGRVASSNIVTKKIQALALLAMTDPTEEEAATAFREMADAGALPTRYASVTRSREFAEKTGARLSRWTLTPLLYGPSGIDARARYIMWKVAKQINPNAPPKELNEFINQLGNYTPALWSDFEKKVKSLPFSPFFTAGSTMIRNGINAFFSSGPMITPAGGPRPWTPRNKAELRLWHALTAGVLGTLGLWFLLSKLATGKYPWQDKRSKLLSIPVGGGGTGVIDKYRHSKLGNALWGPGAETGYLNLYTFNPLMRRGMMAMGLPGAYETRILGGTWGQAAEAAQKDAFNTWMHPVAGPIPRASFVGAFGKELYLTSLRDRSGQMSPSFYPAIPPNTKPGWPSTWRRGVGAAMELNAFAQSMGDAAGLHGDQKNDRGLAWLHTAIDMSVIGTGLVGNATNPYARETVLRQQRRAR